MTGAYFERCILVDKKTNISTDKDIAETFNTYFNTITDELKVPKWNPNFKLDTFDLVESIKLKFSSHPSINVIKKNFVNIETFEFDTIGVDDVFIEICKLNKNKKTSGEIPTNVLKFANMASTSISEYITKCFNRAIEDEIFPNELTWADIIPIHKKDSKLDKSNYRPITSYQLSRRFLKKLSLNS